MHMQIHMHVPVGISIMDLLILCGTRLFQVNRSTIGSDKLPWKWRWLEWRVTQKKRDGKRCASETFLGQGGCCSCYVLQAPSTSQNQILTNNTQQMIANVDHNFQWIQQGYIFGSSWPSGADEETRCAYTRVPPEGYPSFDSTLAAWPRQASMRDEFCWSWYMRKMLCANNSTYRDWQYHTVSIIDIEHLRTTGNLCFELFTKNLKLRFYQGQGSQPWEDRCLAEVNGCRRGATRVGTW